jgi:cellulose biosynthesis protein BcsQ
MEQMELMPEAPTPPAPAYDANTDPNKIAAGKTELQKLLQQLNGAYDNIFTDC